MIWITDIYEYHVHVISIFSSFQKLLELWFEKQITNYYEKKKKEKELIFIRFEIKDFDPWL